MIRIAASLITFYAGWLGCILSAARGVPMAAWAVVAVVVAVQLTMLRDRGRQLVVAGVLAVAGATADTTLAAAGLLRLEMAPGASALFFAWILAMWLNFCITVNIAYRWLRGRVLLTAVLAVIAAPTTYWAGAKLGALSLGDPAWLALTALAIEWAIAMPIIVRLARTAEPDTLDRAPSKRGAMPA